MQVLLINGSPRRDGHTATALSLLDDFFQKKKLKQSGFNLIIRHCEDVLVAMGVRVKTDVPLVMSNVMS